MARDAIKAEIRLIELSSSRPVIREAVDSLAASMSGIGLIQPVTVRREKVFGGSAFSDGYRVVVGNHRVEAAKKLGWTEIDAFVFDGSRLEGELAEIDENLCRAELTPTQEAEQLKRRKAIWGSVQDERREVLGEAGAKPVSGQVDPKLSIRGRDGEGRPEGFATETATVTGKSKETINRAIRRATAVCQEARDLIRGTALDTGSYLDGIAKKSMTDAEQVAFVKEGLRVMADRARDQKSIPAATKGDDKSGERDMARLTRLAAQTIGEIARLARAGTLEDVVEAMAAQSIDPSLKPYIEAIYNACAAASKKDLSE